MYFQVVLMVHFLKQFLIDNPLCIVNDEVGKVKKELLSDEDRCKLMQSSSQILLKIKEEEYYMGFKITVPPDYPAKQIQYVKGQQNISFYLSSNILKCCTQSFDFSQLSFHFNIEFHLLKDTCIYKYCHLQFPNIHNRVIFLFVIDKEQKRVVNESSPLNLTSLFYNAQSTIQKSQQYSISVKKFQIFHLKRKRIYY